MVPATSQSSVDILHSVYFWEPGELELPPCGGDLELRMKVIVETDRIETTIVNVTLTCLKYLFVSA